MPAASKLLLLEQLHTIAPGTKVRFLGCVHTYDAKRAQAVLRCSYPATSPDVPAVIVNIENVLENVHHELLEVGAWLNIVGYVEKSPAISKRATSKDADHKARTPVFVGATMIWSAGAIMLDRYQAAVQAYQKPLVAG